MADMSCGRCLLMAFLFKALQGTEVTKRYPLTGVEACKELCVLQMACNVMLYDSVQLSCNLMRISKAPVPKDSTIIIKKISKHEREGCNELQCRTGVCIKSRSSKPLCGFKCCPKCEVPPSVPNTDVALTRSYYGGVAEYTCRPNYGFLSGRTRYFLSCLGNCRWKKPHFKCHKTALTENEIRRSNRLPLPFSAGRSVRIHGKAGPGGEFVIDFKRDSDILLRINPKFYVNSRRVYKRVVCYRRYTKGRWIFDKEKTEFCSREFPFRKNAPFALTVRRGYGKYEIYGLKLMVSFKDHNRYKDANTLEISAKPSLTVYRIEMTID